MSVTRKLIKHAAKSYGVNLTFETTKKGHIFAYIDGKCLNSASNRNRGYSLTGPAADRFEYFVKDDLRRVCK